MRSAPAGPSLFAFLAVLSFSAPAYAVLPGFTLNPLVFLPVLPLVLLPLLWIPFAWRARRRPAEFRRKRSAAFLWTNVVAALVTTGASWPFGLVGYPFAIFCVVVVLVCIASARLAASLGVLRFFGSTPVCWLFGFLGPIGWVVQGAISEQLRVFGGVEVLLLPTAFLPLAACLHAGARARLAHEDGAVGQCSGDAGDPALAPPGPVQ